MNKTQLIDAVAKAADLNKKQAEAAVNAVTGAITDALKDYIVNSCFLVHFLLRV